MSHVLIGASVSIMLMLMSCRDGHQGADRNREGNQISGMESPVNMIDENILTLGPKSANSAKEGNKVISIVKECLNDLGYKPTKVYKSSGTEAHFVSIYGISGSVNIGAILNKLSERFSGTPYNNICIEFYESEVFHDHEGGIKARGNEVLLARKNFNVGK